MSRFALFYQSVISDWNHGNAHFLRGLVRALQARGHSVVCYEQVDNWSLSNLLRVAPEAIPQFEQRFPDISYERYALDPDLESWLRRRLADVEVAIVHEWNEPSVVRLVGRLCRELGIRSAFHDTHYRVVLDPCVPRPARPGAVRPDPGLQPVAGAALYRAWLYAGARPP